MPQTDHSNTIHPSAIVSEHAQLGKNNQIAAYVIIEDDVIIGDNNIIMSAAVIKSGSRVGNHNNIHEHVVLSGNPQDLSFDLRTKTYVELGDHNTLREYVSINRATKKDAATRLGQHNYLMSSCHVAHDCQLANNIIIAPSAALAGHVHIDDRAFISGGVMVHQFVHIGFLAMIGGNTKITQNVLPMMITNGSPATLRGLNIVGLKRNGYTISEIRCLKNIYQLINKPCLPFSEKIKELRQIDDALGALFADFIEFSERGFHRKQSE